MNHAFYTGNAYADRTTLMYLNAGETVMPIKTFSTHFPKIVDTHAVAAGGAAMPITFAPRVITIDINARRYQTIERARYLGKTARIAAKFVELVAEQVEQDRQLLQALAADTLQDILKKTLDQVFAPDNGVFAKFLNGFASGGHVYPAANAKNHRRCPTCSAIGGSHKPSCVSS
ncbi:MAG: hypothetical protein ACAH80_08690 [Alphaproteobacteria bacterium]